MVLATVESLPKEERKREIPGQDGVLQTFHLGPMDLELGGHLREVVLAYRTWGRLNAAGDNAVLVLHALTGDSQAGGEGGWWEPLISADRAIDTNRHFVVCSNVLGGCAGSTGPASLDPITHLPYGPRFPLVTIGDIVAAQRRLAERLGITKLLAIGGSIGGFQALEWATRHADLVASTVAIAVSGRLDALGIAIHSEVGRRAIVADPDWQGGDYLIHETFPANGLAVARMAAMPTYLSREILTERFGRNPASRPPLVEPFGPTFDIEGYLHHQGRSLARRFDANSYLYLTKAMDLYDVGRNGGEERWLRRLAAPLLLLGVRSDWLFPPEDIRRLAALAADLGRDVTYTELNSPNGHEAFLKDWDLLSPHIREVTNR